MSTTTPGVLPRRAERWRLEPPRERWRLEAPEHPVEPWRMLAPGKSCTVGYAASPIGARLAPDCAAPLRRALDCTRVDGLEAGCWLFGRASESLMDVTAVVDANPGAERTRDSSRPDWERLQEAEARMRAQGLELVGLCHSHPGGRTSPSNSDLDFGAAFRSSPRRVLAIAVLDSEGRWGVWPWIVRPGAAGRDRCELAGIAA